MTRDEALALMGSTNYPAELRIQDHEFIAKKLGVTVDQLEEICARPPVHYSAYPKAQASAGRVFAFTARLGGQCHSVVATVQVSTEVAGAQVVDGGGQGGDRAGVEGGVVNSGDRGAY